MKEKSAVKATPESDNLEEIRAIRLLLKKLDAHVRALGGVEPGPATLVEPPETSAMHKPDVFGCWVSFETDGPGSDEFSELVKEIGSLDGVRMVIAGEPIQYGTAGGREIRTAGDLKRALRDVPDNLPVKVDAYQEDGELEIEGPITRIGVEDVSPDADDEAHVLVIGCSHYKKADRA